MTTVQLGSITVTLGKEASARGTTGTVRDAFWTTNGTPQAIAILRTARGDVRVPAILVADRRGA